MLFEIVSFLFKEVTSCRFFHKDVNIVFVKEILKIVCIHNEYTEINDPFNQINVCVM